LNNSNYSAADPVRLKEAKHKERRVSEKQNDDMFNVLSTIEGRRVLWRILEHCKSFQSIWDNSAKIHYNAGQQDVGHFLIKAITEANPKAYIQMLNDKQNGDI
jgi:hypothetical protein